MWCVQQLNVTIGVLIRTETNGDDPVTPMSTAMRAEVSNDSTTCPNSKLFGLRFLPHLLSPIYVDSFEIAMLSVDANIIMNIAKTLGYTPSYQDHSKPYGVLYQTCVAIRVEHKP
ncbi:unnamed protein product [Protopolystoma xenopodis]|uniref:Uncharacterized protein n=1 Tax=Protopolystoma xenopodis TaxID=117903 RepID=A0A3S5B0D3_9PLAT|nr:unnamed protein product [Protopolystoma xenopodis]